MPRVKVLNYLKKVALFFCFERDILAVRHRLTLALAKLTQHLKVNTVIAEFLFHKSVGRLETCCHHFLAQLVDVSKDGVSALG